MKVSHANNRAFSIVQCNEILKREQLETLLMRLPIQFYVVDDAVQRERVFQEQVEKQMDVYHFASVVSIHPLAEMLLSVATILDEVFSLRQFYIMDDQLGLRCSYRPHLITFGISVNDALAPTPSIIELDIHKYAHDA